MGQPLSGDWVGIGWKVVSDCLCSPGGSQTTPGGRPGPAPRQPSRLYDGPELPPGPARTRVARPGPPPAPPRAPPTSRPRHSRRAAHALTSRDRSTACGSGDPGTACRPEHAQSWSGASVPPAVCFNSWVCALHGAIPHASDTTVKNGRFLIFGIKEFYLVLRSFISNFGDSSGKSRTQLLNPRDFTDCRTNQPKVGLYFCWAPLVLISMDRKSHAGGALLCSVLPDTAMTWSPWAAAAPKERCCWCAPQAGCTQSEMSARLSSQSFPAPACTFHLLN